MEFVKEHQCEVLEKAESISVEQYLHNNKKYWFHNNDRILNEIMFCPYCGEKLKG